ncbi:hypothetical protein [Actinacidiphila reveromycinica]|nr:hypothetical protein [Streptomyces sp. SN-593]
MATITIPTFTTTVPASELEAGMAVWLDGDRRWVFEATVDGESIRLRIEGFTTPFTVPAGWTYTVHTPITPSWITAAELEAGMQIRMDGIRRVYEAEIDGDTMRFRVEGFSTPFTVPVGWQYSAYIAPATSAA